MLHITGRALWVGAIGLRYVSGDIDYAVLRYHPRVDKFLRKKMGSFDDYIEKLERFCSVIFAYSYLLIFLLLGWLICSFIGLLILTGGLSSQLLFLRLSVFFIYLACCWVVFIDFITLGWVKRSRRGWLIAIYMPVMKVFSWITLSKLYRPLLYNFLDHRYSRRLLKISIPYFFLVFGFILYIDGKRELTMDFMPFKDKDTAQVVDHFSPYTVHWSNYDDLRREFVVNKPGMTNERIIEDVSLPSYRVGDRELEVFLRLYPSDGIYLREEFGLERFEVLWAGRKLWHIGDFQDSLAAEMNNRYRKLNSKCDTCLHSLQGLKMQYEEILDSAMARAAALHRSALTGLFELRIDRDLLGAEMDCHYFIHPNAGEQGLRCMVPIDSLAYGSHFLEIKRRLYDPQSPENMEQESFIVPFYKSR